jgi:hypothetical protein
MLKRVLIVITVIAVFVVGWTMYNRNARNSMGSGDVVSTDSSKGSADSGNTDLDGRPVAAAVPTPSRSDAPGTINGEPVAGATTTSNQPPPAQKAAIAQTFPAAPAMASTPVSLPVSDTVAPNAPNGLAFGGTGKFQWYRQGNLTWRVNTASGSTCIAFATMEEWRKSIVSSHGCGNS